MAKLPLSDIVDIRVNLSPRSTVRKDFNLALIIGDSDIINPDDRIKIYSGLEGLIADEFTDDMPEYQAASLYFQQNPKPNKVAIGRWAPAESAVDAVKACRNKNSEWYTVTVCDATSDEILKISEYIEAAAPHSLFGFTASDSNALTDNDTNIFNQLKALNRRRTFGQYSATKYAVAAIIGYAMGANSKTIQSAYTLMHKTEVGVTPDDLDDTQVAVLQKTNANYYVSRGYDGEYSMFETGVMSDGTYFDEMLNLDMLVNDMQTAILDLLKSRPKIPQTESGVSEFRLAIKPSLDKAVQTGFIAPGKWQGSSIYLKNGASLETGDMLPNGYMILSEPVSSLSQQERDRRISPPLYTPITLAGAVHTMLVQIDVNR